VAESYTICSYRSRRRVRKLLDTPLYTQFLRRYGPQCRTRRMCKSNFCVTGFEVCLLSRLCVVIWSRWQRKRRYQIRTLPSEMQMLLESRSKSCASHWHYKTWSHEYTVNIAVIYDAGKVKLYLCLTKHHAMKTWGSGGIAPSFLNLGTWWMSSQLHAPVALPPGKENLVPIG
jgi:hypothetical protein